MFRAHCTRVHHLLLEGAEGTLKWHVGRDEIDELSLADGARPNLRGGEMRHLRAISDNVVRDGECAPAAGSE